MSVKCLVHKQCKATVRINGVPVCYECWNSASSKERGWYKRATEMYTKGLLTKEDLESYLAQIAYHHIDPTVPIWLD